MYRRSRGFTLIELLVVIAIIAILAAILFPVFSAARKNAQDAKCISNLRQIGSALDLYLQDSNGRYPYYYAYCGDASSADLDPSTEIPSAVGLARVLFRYSKTDGIWNCRLGAQRPRATFAVDHCVSPPNVRAYLVGWVRLPNGKWISSNYVSYPLDAADAGPGQPPYEEFCRGWTPLEAMQKWGRIFTPPNGVMWKKGYHQPLWNNRLIQDAYQISPVKWRPHRQGTNILFYDGHVARVPDYRPGND